jgi:hypothetical protein
VFIGQCVHEHVLYVQNVALSPTNNILITSVLISTLHLIYIDDGGVLGYDVQVVTSELERMKSAYAAVGLKVNQKKSIAPSMDPVSVIGVTVCGRQQRIFVSPAKLIPLLDRTLVLLTVGSCTGHAMSVLIGHWCWYLLLNRKLLSVLQQVYRFIQIFQRCVDVKVIWPTVRTELVLLCNLAPLIQIELNSGVASRIIATDASGTGYGVVVNRMDEHFPAVEPKLLELALHVGLNSFPCDSSLFTGVDKLSLVIESIGPGGEFVSDQPVLVLSHTTRFRHRVEISSLVRSLRDSVDWLTIMSGRWHFNDSSTHINELELASVLLSVRWLSSLLLSRGSNRRVVLLVDNAVALYSLKKGRSSAIRLLAIIRRISALCLAMDIRLKIIYIASEWNPADAASRILQ